MTIGQGIAIAAMWLLPLGGALSKSVTGVGLIFCVCAALLGTWIVH